MTEPIANPRKHVSLVIPMYNEGDAIDVLFARLDAVLPTLGQYDFELVCVNDGSTDQTLATLMHASATRANLVVVDLSRNFGKEAALSAGLFIATGDAEMHPPDWVVRIDAGPGANARLPQSHPDRTATP